MSQDPNIRGLVQRWFALHRDPPTLLYHYTNAAGLFGMLKSKKMWATNSRFLNDPTEMEYAIQLVWAVAQTELAGRGSQIKRLKQAIFDRLQRYQRESRVHVACLCAEGDLLSQWRGYGAVGGGYSLGIVAKYLGTNRVRTYLIPSLFFARSYITVAYRSESFVNGRKPWLSWRGPCSAVEKQVCPSSVSIHSNGTSRVSSMNVSTVLKTPHTRLSRSGDLSGLTPGADGRLAPSSFGQTVHAWCPI
jgi:hypothetical protein